ncbi:MAG: response regulator [Lachnospirales bacterium]
MNIVVVDDEMLLRVGIKSMLNSYKEFNIVASFDNGEAAFKFIKDNDVDVLVTDIEMLGLDGLSLVENIKKHKNIGIIILSCHNNFDYARKALSLGVNNYLLKYEINEETLVSELRKLKKVKIRSAKPIFSEESKNRKYIIGTYHLYNDENELDTLNFTMATSLIDEIIKKYNMGELFCPNGKNNFIIFFLDDMNYSDEVINFINILKNNIYQYTNYKIYFGISSLFFDLSDVKIKYEEALESLEFIFYAKSKTVYYYESIQFEEVEFTFNTCNFFDESWTQLFKEQYIELLKRYMDDEVAISILKNSITQKISKLFYQVMFEYNLNDVMINRFNEKYKVADIVYNSENVIELQKRIIKVVALAREELRGMIFISEIDDILSYINIHYKEKINLEEFCKEMHMSVSSFCSKFRDRTGLTFVKYINFKRVEYIKKHLRIGKMTLEDLADEVGYSNVNYMTRVFKKVTGITVSEYKKIKF